MPSYKWFSAGTVQNRWLRNAGVMAAEDEKQTCPDETLDSFRRRVMDYGNLHDSRDTAPLRISFTHIPDVEVEG